MNAIPLINIAPPRNDNINRVSNKLNNIPVSQNISGAVGMLGSSGFNNETQLRQEVNTSLVALKREAFNLETLINQAAKTLTDVNNRIAALENVQGDYVKKTDVTDTIASGNMNPVTSNAVATSNAMPVNSVTSGNLHSVTSGAVYSELATKISQGIEFGNDNSTSTITLGKGMYMFLLNFHPSVNQTGFYLISIASTPNYNRVFTVDNNNTITLSVSSSSNVLTLTTTTVFRGLLIKVSDSPAV